ncbi:MAG: ABC transporter ATP-binding protein [Xanthomonadales bacterium]|nr:ABC transporter ATP-binding protein [Xanthomonadales bacterium]
MTVLAVNQVGKAYRKYRSEWQRVARWVGLPARPSEETWVLRDINLELHAGQALGLIGQNGAGKSTLLKIITGTLAPTTGSVSVAGRIAAMLELGMGFQSELTGRQNAYHAAGLMGFSHAHIQSKMDAIEEFAEIGEYFDQPVRTYSSGMQARLAFAVATFEPPEILIVDEVLSVGDSYFQHKSFNRILQFREQGTSLLFVSHSMGDVKKLCDRAVLLDQGRVLKQGLPDEIVDFYNALIAAKENENLTVEQRRDKGGWLYTRSGSFEATVASLKLLDQETGHEISKARVGQLLRLKLVVRTEDALDSLVVGFLIRDKLGNEIWGTNTWHTNQTVENPPSGKFYEVSLEFECRLGPGSYSITTALHGGDSHVSKNIEWSDNLIVFDVINADHQHFIGSNFLPVQIYIMEMTEEHALGYERIN